MPRLNPPVYPQDMQETAPLLPSWVSDTQHVEHYQGSNVDTTAATAGGSTERLLPPSPENRAGESTVHHCDSSSVYSIPSEISNPFTDEHSYPSNTGSFMLKLVDSLQVTRERAKRKFLAKCLAKVKRLGSTKRREGPRQIRVGRKPSLREKLQGWFGATS